MQQPVFHRASSIDDATDARREGIQRRTHACQQKNGRHRQLNDLCQVGDVGSGADHAKPRMTVRRTIHQPFARRR
jgi:hypothetical protein